MKYYCEDCGTIYYEDELDEETVRESEEIWGSRQSWEYTEYRCPNCGGNVSAYYGRLDAGENIFGSEDEEENEEDA